MDSDPNGSTLDNNDAPGNNDKNSDLVDESENANKELDADGSGDENPSFGDPFDGGDNAFEGKGVGEGVEVDMHG